MSTAPIGVLGGTFDPIHYGHLRLAEELGEKLRLDEVRFVPSGTPPHRSAPAVTADHRLAMTRLAAASNTRLKVDEREVRRAAPGYTFDTLRELRAEAGGTRPLALLLGADAFLEFATWHRWQEIFGLAHIAIAHRPGFPVERWTERMPQPLAREYSGPLLQQPPATARPRANPRPASCSNRWRSTSRRRAASRWSRSRRSISRRRRFATCCWRAQAHGICSPARFSTIFEPTVCTHRMRLPELVQ